ncbi:uncharacterized protein TNCV_634241 [Trichonephila clavipes]|nr:uncharacterized protein TNCV_634241 [Trichonephila clavipes]
MSLSRMQFLQTLKPIDYDLRAKVANNMLMHANENLMDYVVFSDESTFHLNEHVIPHNARIWSFENPHEVLELQQDSPKLNVFAPYLGGKYMGLSFSKNQL